MDAFGLIVPILMFGLFLAAAKILRACGLRPDEQFVLPRPQRVTTIGD